MNPSLRRFRPLAVAALCAMIAPAAFAVTATTDPVGFIKVSYQGNADSYTFIPFKRTPEYAGSITSVTGGNVLTASGTPNFGNLVFGEPAQPKTYFILLTSGPKLGMFYTVTANSSNSVTVDTLGDDLSAVATSNFQIIPYDTLGTVFPGGQGVNASTSFLAASRQSEVLIPNNATAGTNLAAAKSYFYYTSVSNPSLNGWRQAGNNSRIANNDILVSDTPLIIRHNVATATETTFMGTVHMGTLTTPLGIIDAAKNQDNPIALPIAASLSLTQLNLFESGAFAPSTSFIAGSRKDELLVWDNTLPGVTFGKNNAAFKSYYYYTSVSNPSLNGWRKSGDNATIANNDIVLTSTTQLTVRKKTTGVASTVIWSVKPPYAPVENP